MPPSRQKQREFENACVDARFTHKAHACVRALASAERLASKVWRILTIVLLK